MIGDKIKELRIASGLTQKDLAEKLFVTAQAVSRWENGEVEPSINTITEISKIFKVTVDEIVGNSSLTSEEQNVVVEKEYVYKEQQPVLAVCENCNKPIYDGNEIVRFDTHHGRNSSTSHVWCKTCDTEKKERKHKERIEKGIKRRKCSFIFGPLIALIFLGIMIARSVSNNDWSNLYIIIIGTVCIFTLISCLILNNNFIGEMMRDVFSWGFIKLPGLIFTLDLDGIIWLLTVKLLFWILGLILASICGLLSLSLGLFTSVFVYPFALNKNINHPDVSEDF